MRIGKELSFLVHEGGTKFYEVARFSCVDTRRHVVVRRWSKIAGKSNGGGEIKIEIFDNLTTASRSARQVLDSKTKPSKSGGAYSLHSLATGLGDGVDEFEHDMLPAVLRVHYGPQTALSILTNLGLADADARDEEDREETDRLSAQMKARTPKPEPVRAADWNSW